MLKRKLLVVGAAAVVLLATAWVANAAGSSTAAPAAAKNINTFVTLYGWGDNSPPGNGISGGRIHSHAGEPLTFLKRNAEFFVGFQQLGVDLIQAFGAGAGFFRGGVVN